MSLTVTSPITGVALTGLTTPTFTLASDSPPDLNSYRYVITALGGTQTGATAQTGADNPFDLTLQRAPTLRQGPSVDSLNRIIGQPGRNITRISGRKGMRVNSASSQRFPAYIRVEISIPAGAESVDPAEIKSFLSMEFGAMYNNAQGICDTVITGVKG